MLAVNKGRVFKKKNFVMGISIGDVVDQIWLLEKKLKEVDKYLPE